MYYSSYDFTRQKDGYLGMTNLMCPLKQRDLSKLVTEMEVCEIGAHRGFVAGFEEGGGHKLRNTGSLLELRVVPG